MFLRLEVDHRPYAAERRAARRSSPPPAGPVGGDRRYATDRRRPVSTEELVRLIGWAAIGLVGLALMVCALV